MRQFTKRQMAKMYRNVALFATVYCLVRHVGFVAMETGSGDISSALLEDKGKDLGAFHLKFEEDI